MQVVKGQDGGVRDDYFDKRPLEFYMKDHVAKSEHFVLKDHMAKKAFICPI